tara:strand:- start:1177 stop:2088 length:912 start_codon:yes stop_codon:yes gene_type:complete
MKTSYYVESTFNNTRIDRWIKKNIYQIPQSLIEKLLRNGKIKLNSKKVKSSTKVITNDRIDAFNLKIKKFIKQEKIKFIPSKNIIKSNEKMIIDNNDDFIVLNKNSGISVQGGTKSKKNLLDIFANSEIFSKNKPFSVHRLDKDTSGVLIMAKHRKSAQLLTSLFRLRRVHKTYLAICHGELEKNSGVWENNLIRYEKKKEIVEKAKTIFKVLDKNSSSSLVEMNPITGRKHQLRKQLFAVGNPVYGDQKYKLNQNQKFNKNLMLHSYKIKFMINNKKYTYIALLPDYFKKLLKVKKLKFSNN